MNKKLWIFLTPYLSDSNILHVYIINGLSVDERYLRMSVIGILFEYYSPCKDDIGGGVSLSGYSLAYE